MEKSRIGKEWGKEHLTFVPLTKDNRLCAKEIIGNRANLTKWQDDFHAYMVEKYQEAYPHPAFQAGGQSLQTGKSHGSYAGRHYPAERRKEERGSPRYAEKVISADGEFLRAVEKIQGHNQ